MTRLAAFLRAINVGGHTVKMDLLRSLFEDIGFSDVSTFIASGNVLFTDGTPGRSDTAPEMEDRIATHLETVLGFEVATFLRTDTQLDRISRHEPFAGTVPREGDTLHIAFLGRVPRPAEKARVLALPAGEDLLAFRGSELYWLRRGKLMDSALSGALIEKSLGQAMTMRSANTVAKVAAKLAARSTGR